MPAAIDHDAYPHILDLIVANCHPFALFALRATNKAWRDRIHSLLVRHLSLSATRQGWDIVRKVEAFLRWPGSTARKHRLPFMMPQGNEALLFSRRTWERLGAHVEVLDLQFRNYRFWKDFEPVLSSIRKVSTIRNYSSPKARDQSNPLMRSPSEISVPHFACMVLQHDFPNVSVERLFPAVPLQQRLVFLQPFPTLFGPRSPLIRRCDAERWFVLIFLAPDETKTSARLRAQLFDIFYNIKRLLGALSAPDFRVPITLVNFSAWASRKVCPSSYQDMPDTLWRVLDAAFLRGADMPMWRVRFQSPEEYCAWVGEDQVRLELGPEMCRQIGL